MMSTYYRIIAYLFILFRPAVAKLLFQPFQPIIPCADGTPAGIYSNIHQQKNTEQYTNEHKHILVFEGGGACTDPLDCIDEYKHKPYKFSSEYLRNQIEGHTILSENPNDDNPFHNHTKWLVPYCTQDLFLGDLSKGEIGSFNHGGSDIFNAAIQHWQKRVQEIIVNSNQDGKEESDISQLVVVGISAGAIGVMNHVKVIQDAAKAVDISTLRYILDAPSTSDSWDDKNITNTMQIYVNLTDHPLCDGSHEISQRYYPSMTDLPCCMSSHCMLRHDPAILSIGSMDKNVSFAQEEILLLDSSYDPFALKASSKQKSSNNNEEEDLDSFVGFLSDAWLGAQTAGSRLSRSLETSRWTMPWHTRGETVGPTGYWYITSCVTHSFFLPSVELSHRPCHHGNFGDKDYDIECQSNGNGVTSDIKQIDTKITLWFTDDVWKLARVNGTPIRDIIATFVSDTNDINAEQDGQFVVVSDGCDGPNCSLQKGEANQCQQLLELDETFVPVPFSVQVGWYTVIGFLILTSLAWLPWARVLAAPVAKIRTSQLWKNQFDIELGMQSAPKLSKESLSLSSKKSIICSVEGLCVSTPASFNLKVSSNTTPPEAQVLDNISIKIQEGSTIALMGRSGSGKTTLLKVLGQQSLDNMQVSSGDVEMNCPQGAIAFLRQADSIKMEDMTAKQYLAMTARIYGADSTRTADCKDFVQRLFCRDTETGLNPFKETKIKNLSGGQRRILALASTVLITPKLILLDEPLSGLDDASGIMVMEFIKFLSDKYQCAVVLSLHNPSDEVIKSLDRIILLDNGKEKMEWNSTSDIPLSCVRGLIASTMSDCLQATWKKTPGTNLLLPPQNSQDENVIQNEEADNAGNNDLDGTVSTLVSDNIPPMCEKDTNLDDDQQENAICTEMDFQASGCNLDLKDQVDEVGSVHAKTGIVVMEETKMKRHPSRASIIVDAALNMDPFGPLIFFTKTMFLCQRLHANYGADKADLLTLPLVFMLLAVVLRFDDGSPVQEILVAALFIGIPVNIFRHKIHLSCKMWTGHIMELSDMRITVLSYQLATQTFSFAIPLLSLSLSHILAYWVLGWNWESMPSQILFSAAHLLVALQIGRSICVYFQGDYRKFSRFYSVFIFISFLFGGLLVPTRQLPTWMAWLYVFSFSFWGISGASLNILRYHDSTKFCVDAVSCIASDGAFIARYRGFSPLSNEYLALSVLTLFFALLCVVEYLLLRYRCKTSRLVKSSVKGK